MKKVVITGANGFVGSNTVSYFLKQGISVLGIDIGEKAKVLTNSDNYRYKQCDISDRNELLKIISEDKYDTFVHFAWGGSAGKERQDYNLQLKNAIDTVECMKTARKAGCMRFVCAGSIMEYEAEFVVRKQGSRPGMGYIYGMGKYIAHCLCKMVAADIGIELVWGLITNAYGVGEISPRFVNTTLRKIINNELLQFTAATQNYDFVYIDDVARAFYLVAENGQSFCEYIIGSSNARPLKEFIIEIQQEIAPNSIFKFGDISFTGINMPLRVFDTLKTENDCGFKAEVSFVEGIRKTYEWLRNGGKINGSEI